MDVSGCLSAIRNATLTKSLMQGCIQWSKRIHAIAETRVLFLAFPGLETQFAPDLKHALVILAVPVIDRRLIHSAPHGTQAKGKRHRCSQKYVQVYRPISVLTASIAALNSFTTSNHIGGLFSSSPSAERASPLIAVTTTRLASIFFFRRKRAASWTAGREISTTIATFFFVAIWPVVFG